MEIVYCKRCRKFLFRADGTGKVEIVCDSCKLKQILFFKPIKNEISIDKG